MATRRSSVNRVVGARSPLTAGDIGEVLIFDLDHFKRTNDRFGHALGDRVLKLFAATVRTHLEELSIVARLGGEEFAAILPGVDRLGAVETGEAVRRAFAKSGAFVDGLAVGATVSVGVAWDAGGGGDLNALFAAPTRRFTQPSAPGATASSCWIPTPRTCCLSSRQRLERPIGRPPASLSLRRRQGDARKACRAAHRLLDTFRPWVSFRRDRAGAVSPR